MITEMDISALPSPKDNKGADVDSRVEYKNELNPYTKGLPEEVEKPMPNVTRNSLICS